VERSADYMKKYPDLPITFLLETNSRHSYLTWRVIWGNFGGHQQPLHLRQCGNG
jgi:hypothetical protein